MQYILVHGAWQGGWCWEFVANELHKLGQKCTCLDLPGHGKNSFPLSKVTYNTYFECLEAEIRKQDKVVIVAHSMSGILAAPLLDMYFDKIEHLFLIAAYVAQNGKSLLDLAVKGKYSEIPHLLITDQQSKTQTLDLSKAKNALFHDCSDEIALWAMQRLQASPMEPFKAKVRWKDSGKAIDKRTYIVCELDRDVHITTQLDIIQSYPCKVIKLASGHFPFLSQPERLAQILTKF
ncbi:acetoin dehydrogenase E2 subunit dihydrolipoyllysine-residue acetyltransferase [Candidatus Rubidus massiliensis]|nr:MAG: hypothetical protein BGO10_04200 [Chlamydia sp. 32-24]CDZ80839.1 acetoin dehydrogenase E2 subunit dihydrolipoyllysine-residue acetyltransferase [Candidatus Rubidus massiliensis]